MGWITVGIESVLILFLILLVLMILDWVFGIDKLNPLVEDILDEYTDVEIATPIIGTMLLSELCMIISWITADRFTSTLYLVFGMISIGGGLLIITFVIIAKLLYRIRQYFLSRKKV